MNNFGHIPFTDSKKFAARRLHLGITGSIAAYKAADLLRAWLKLNIGVSATLTAGAREFISDLLMRALGANPVYGDMFAAEEVFGHLAPGQRVDAFVVAPASADFVAKMAHGLADDMLAAQYLAFCGPVVIAPAMNPRMWQHKATQDNLATLKKRAVVCIEPGIGTTACGEKGQGRLADLPEIFLGTLQALSPQDMADLKVMVTLGPTREAWDGARFWSNPSSGRMGAALAVAAWLRGARVYAIAGPGINVYLPKAISRIDVTTAQEMYLESQKLWPEMDMGLFCAAVADFAPVRPKEGSEIKLKKDQLGESFELEFRENPDILRDMAARRKPGQKILGFAAEITPDLQALRPLAQNKLRKKGADLIAANRVNSGEGAFGAACNSMLVVDANGREAIWQEQPKADIAWDLLSWLLKI